MKPEILEDKIYNDRRCPACNSANRVSLVMFRKAIEEGSVDPDEVAMEVVGKALNLSPVGLTAEVMVLYKDGCDDCGCEFTFRRQIQKAVVTGDPRAMGGPSGPGIPPFAGKG